MDSMSRCLDDPLTE